MEKNYLILVAAGKGKRFGLPLPKQYYLIDNKPIWYYTLKKFLETSLFYSHIIVVSDEFIDKVKKEISIFFKNNDNIQVIKGGEERYLSVFNGLKYIKERLSPSNNDILVVHDAVRPLIKTNYIKEILTHTKEYTNAILCNKEINTVRYWDGNNYKLIDRENVIQIQTPQAAKFQLLYDAYTKVINAENFKPTDESSVLEYYGSKLHFVFGDPTNIKITTQDDINFVEFMLKKDFSK